MLENCTIHPDVMPDVMLKYKEKFYKKASHLSNHYSPSLDVSMDTSSIIEWEDGWAQFSMNENQLIIHSMFSSSKTTFKFEYLHELAKCLKKKEIIFETERNPKGWIRLIDASAKKLNKKSKTRLISYVLAVTVD